MTWKNGWMTQWRACSVLQQEQHQRVFYSDGAVGDW